MASRTTGGKPVVGPETRTLGLNTNGECTDEENIVHTEQPCIPTSCPLSALSEGAGA